VRVVIVDDHRLFVDALALLLGHDDRLTVIGTAVDGHTAIALAASQAAEVAVIDVRMPEIDGLETARRLRKRSPETRVILVTGLDEPQLAERRAKLVRSPADAGALHDELKKSWPQHANRAKAARLLSPRTKVPPSRHCFSRSSFPPARARPSFTEVLQAFAIGLTRLGVQEVPVQRCPRRSPASPACPPDRAEQRGLHTLARNRLAGVITGVNTSRKHLSMRCGRACPSRTDRACDHGRPR
jgi:CheY-like chemotaxis protein